MLSIYAKALIWKVPRASELVKFVTGELPTSWLGRLCGEADDTISTFAPGMRTPLASTSVLLRFQFSLDSFAQEHSSIERTAKTDACNRSTLRGFRFPLGHGIFLRVAGPRTTTNIFRV